jgi:two-component system response regulator YesN
MKRNRDVLKHSFLRRLLEGHERLEDTIEFGKRLGIRWDYPHYAVCLGSLDMASFTVHYTRKDVPLIEYGIYNIAQEISVKMKAKYCSVQLTPFLMHLDQAVFGHYTFLIAVNFHNRLEVNIYEVIREYAYEVRQRVRDYLKVSVRFIGSRDFTDLHHIRKTVTALKKADTDYYYHDSFLEFANSACSTKWNKTDAALLAMTSDEFFMCMKKQQYSSISGIFKQAANTAKQERSDPWQWIAACVRWLQIIHAEMNVPLAEDAYYLLQRSRRWTESIQIMERQMTFVESPSAAVHTAYEKEPKLQMIDQYILDHISETITTVSMAQHLFLNPNYFSRYFKKITKENFIDYVHRYKIELAVKLLQNKFETVESIAMKLGYSDRTYFSRVFKKYRDMTPSEYRDRNS